MANFSKAAAAIQAQIAALQAQLQEVLAQEGLVPAPEPEVAPLTEEEEALRIAQEEPAEAAYEALDDEDQIAQAFEEAAAATMQEAVEQRLLSQLPVEEQAAIEYDKPSISPRRLAAHRERKKQGYPKRRAAVDAGQKAIVPEGFVGPPSPQDMAAEDTLWDRDRLIAEGYTHFPDDPAPDEPAPDEPAPDLAEELGYPLDPQLEAAIDADIAAAAAPAAAEAVAVPAEEDEEALRLFSVVHGGPFDPKSEMDIGKMDILRKLLAAQGGLGDMSDTQFALKLYRQ